MFKFGDSEITILDDEIFNEANVLFKLSEKNKLFRMENNL